MRAREYDRPIRNLDAFLMAFGNLIALMEPVEEWSGRHWRLKVGASEAEAQRLATEVAILAGPAAEAFDLAGMGIDYKPPGTMRTKPVNPALIWSSCIGDDPIGEPTMIVTVGIQAVGHLKHRREEQAEREQGVVGKIAWFFTLAPRVRAAAGLPAHTVPGVAVTGVVALMQGLLVAAIGGALAYPIAALFGWIP